jgi:hypothetical protein
MKPVAEFDDRQLASIIDNYRRQGKTADPYYMAALEARARRKGKGLVFDTTLHAVLAAARERRFLSYKQLATASGLEWNNVRYAMNPHLRGLIEYAHRRGWPLISAIVVNQQHLADGTMEPSTMQGFCDAAEELGYAVADRAAFVAAEQARVFEWAKTYEGP